MKTTTLTAVQDKSRAGLGGRGLLSLTTFRKSGEPVATPVYFVRQDDRLYAVTGATTAKLKRLRQTASVEIARCDSRGNILGPTSSAKGRILDRDEAERLKLSRKFPWPMRLFNLRRSIKQGGNVYLEITLWG